MRIMAVCGQVVLNSRSHHRVEGHWQVSQFLFYVFFCFLAFCCVFLCFLVFCCVLLCFLVFCCVFCCFLAFFWSRKWAIFDIFKELLTAALVCYWSVLFYFILFYFIFVLPLYFLLNSVPVWYIYLCSLLSSILFLFIYFLVPLPNFCLFLL